MKPTLLYDADCGFCTKAAGFAPRLHLKVEVASLQSVDLDALGVSPERAVVEMPFVHADGSVVYGPEAIAAALQTGPAPLRVVGRIITLPGIDRIAKPTYAWVAKHRHQLPGGTPACALPPSAPS
ncbi:thiol-disulfide oxidoreductase DCC family protein [Flexivirga alba]|uniref:Thiol-disulfide oxidoreductase DCC family protein n=1 Tax=Flexivirga alba TaxID=702742 RepID=A0ABW2ABZ9_9MICO